MAGCAVMRLLCALALLLSLASAQTSLLSTGLVTMPVYYGVEQTPCKTKGSAYYFNSATQTCETCSGNLVVDQSTRDALGDPTGCTCAAGYYKQTCTQVRAYMNESQQVLPSDKTIRHSLTISLALFAHS